MLTIEYLSYGSGFWLKTARFFTPKAVRYRQARYLYIILRMKQTLQG